MLQSLKETEFTPQTSVFDYDKEINFNFGFVYRFNNFLFITNNIILLTKTL